MMRTPALLLAVALTSFAAACEAGPPAFGSSRVDGRATAERQPADSAAAAAAASADTATADVVVSPRDFRAPTGQGEDPGVSGISADAPDAPASPIAKTALGGSGRALGNARFPRPQHVRGLYVNAWAAGSGNRMDSLVVLARRTEVNAFVIDIKDASGYVSHRTAVPQAREIGATEEIRIRDLPGLLTRLEAEGIYPIARIVIVKDAVLAAARPDLAVQDTAGGVWLDGKGVSWLNPYDTRVWDYHVALAREVAELGFPEIQWDYVRFPDAPRSYLEKAEFPGADGRLKAEVIRDFLTYARVKLEDVGVFMTADVFGVTTSASRDVGIGQLWESFIDAVDVALPMVYPSHYAAGSFGIAKPNAYPYEIVHAALRDAVRRSGQVEGAGGTRPWLQDFTLGAPRYDAPEVRAQMQAAYDAGVEEWVLWNPGSRYTEAALEPIGGFEVEPMMRVAGAIVPVSLRQEALDSARAAAAARDAARAAARADSAAARVVRTPEPLPDSVPASEQALARDTIPGH